MSSPLFSRMRATFFGGRVVGVERDGAVAVREEEHATRVGGHPHRVEVVRVAAGHAFDRGVGETRDPDWRDLAAAIPFPDIERPRNGDVRDARAVGRDGALVAHGQGQRFRKHPVGRDGEEAAEPPVLAQPRRRKQHLCASWRPPCDDVGSRVVGEAPRHAAGGRHGVDVQIAVVLGAEGDRGPVGREERAGFHAHAGGQADGVAAGARHRPQVSRVDEGDVGAAQRRVVGQQRPLLGRRRDRGERDEHQQRGNSAHARVSWKVGEDEVWQIFSDSEPPERHQRCRLAGARSRLPRRHLTG